MNLDQAPLGRMRRVDLAAALAMSQSSVTRVTAPLEKVGLVARDLDPRDARVAYVVLTDAGRQRVHEAVATLDDLSEGAFVDRWSPEEIATLAELLGRLSSPLPGNLR
jgi:DNA-binding MarR family transcriptional regulator